METRLKAIRTCEEKDNRQQTKRTKEKEKGDDDVLVSDCQPHLLCVEGGHLGPARTTRALRFHETLSTKLTVQHRFLTDCVVVKHRNFRRRHRQRLQEDIHLPTQCKGGYNIILQVNRSATL